MHYPKVLERVDSPEEIFHRSFSLGAPDYSDISRSERKKRSCSEAKQLYFSAEIQL